MKMKQMKPLFVEEIPENIDDGILYVCLQYNSIIHKCACGCGERISTPLDREYGWTLKYDGEYVSLYPSIGNGAYNCRSHYFIRDNRIIWLDNIENFEHHVEQKESQHFGKVINCLKNIFSRILKK